MAIPITPRGMPPAWRPRPRCSSYLFPHDEHFFQSRAEEDAASRVWAGIHFRSAIEAGLQLGRDVGEAVIARAESDGAE